MNFKSVTVTLVLTLMLALFAVPAHAQVTVVTPQNYTPNGFTVSSFITTTSSAASTNIDTTKGNIYGLSVAAGAGTAVVYVNFFNATSANVIAGTTAAIFSVVVDGAHDQGQKSVIPWGTTFPTPYSTALSANCTTTINGATHSVAGCVVNALTKH